MSDEGAEQVGSVGEEAAKLFMALGAWAADPNSGNPNSGNPGEGARAGAHRATSGDDQSTTSASAAADAAAAAVGNALHDIGEHLATGGEDCKYCPICRVISAVRSTSPEVKAHLAVAASSLAQAASAALATPTPEEAKDPVEHIDLDDAWDEE